MNKSSAKVLDIRAKLSLKIWKFAIRFLSVQLGVTWNGALVASKMCIFMIRNQWFPRFVLLFWPEFPDQETKTRPYHLLISKVPYLRFHMNQTKRLYYFSFKRFIGFREARFWTSFWLKLYNCDVITA